MKVNRVQFQPGLSMPEFYERYGTEAQCRAALERRAGPRGLPARPAAALRAPVSSAVGCATGSAAPAPTSAA